MLERAAACRRCGRRGDPRRAIAAARARQRTARGRAAARRAVAPSDLDPPVLPACPQRRPASPSCRCQTAFGSQFSSDFFTMRHELVGDGAVDDAVVVAERRDTPSAGSRSHRRSTTGRFSTLPMPRIATCGWLMIGMPNSAPKTPGLVIVNVPPATSSGLSCFARARFARSAIGAAQARRRFFSSAFLIDRHDQPPVERDRDADVDVLVIDDVVAVDRGVDDRHGAQRVDRRLDDERHVGELGAGALELRLLRLADLRDAAEVHLEHRVHVRRRLLARAPCARRCACASPTSSRRDRSRPA